MSSCHLYIKFYTVFFFWFALTHSSGYQFSISLHVRRIPFTITCCYYFEPFSERASIRSLAIKFIDTLQFHRTTVSEPIHSGKCVFRIGIRDFPCELVLHRACTTLICLYTTSKKKHVRCLDDRNWHCVYLQNKHNTFQTTQTSKQEWKKEKKI